jgi:hypothetical protein
MWAGFQRAKESMMRNTDAGKLCQYVPVYLSVDWLGNWTVERGGVVAGAFRTQYQARKFIRDTWGKIAENLVHVHAVQPSRGG